MTDFIPRPGGVKVGGLSRKAQKLQAALEKASNQKMDARPVPGGSATAPKAKTLAGAKKTPFQRKAV